MLRAAVLAAAVLAPAAARTVVPFDFGWRHYLGNPPSTCIANQTFPIDLNGTQCIGLSQAPTATDAASCQAACCGTCNVWQWCPSGAACTSPNECWVGVLGDCWQNSPGWISAATNATGPSADSPSSPAYDDSQWEVVDIPHDFVINGTFNETQNRGQAYLPKNVSWYRHSFMLPEGWAGSPVYILIENALSVSQWWINGRPLGTHASPYTPVIYRLDNVTGGLNAGGKNVLATYIDATDGVLTGWWYEGGGLNRHAYIYSLSPIHIDIGSGIFAPAVLQGAFHPRATTDQGMTVDTAIIPVTATIVNDGVTAATAKSLLLTFTLYAADGVTAVAIQNYSVPGAVNASQSATVRVFQPLTVSNAEVWTVPRPYLYTLVSSLVDAASGSVLDTTNTSVGLRSVVFDADEGLLLNEQPVKQRGYCDHDSFGGVGAAVPDRINLFRMQATRGVGGNSRRTSHNPPPPALLDITDRLGILVLDENRVFDDAPEHSAAMKELVLRDRNHPSVIFWSFCNEVGCGNGATQPTYDFKTVTYEADGSRAVSANMCDGWGTCTYDSPITSLVNMSVQLDVQGFSHVQDFVFENFKLLAPEKPLAATECCSCETQRGEDADLPLAPGVFFNNFNADCVAEQTNWSNLLSYVTGQFVWTMFDYFGEPQAWPMISSAFGSYDLSGFPKAPVWWYRSWWLANITTEDAGRPPLAAANTTTFVRIVESWQNSANGTRTIHVLTNAPQVALDVNGVTFGQSVAVPAFGYATFDAVPFAPGALTATAQDASGNPLATHTTRSWGAPASIILSIDAPSPLTGTGANGAVYLDGGDVALVRATVVDADGVVVANSSLDVTFSIQSGPGLIWGTGSGNPTDHVNVLLPTRPAYHGLARAIVRNTLVAIGSDADRALMALVNPQAGAGPRSSFIMGACATGDCAIPTVIEVAASAPGVPTAVIAIPLSIDPADSVLATAATSVGVAYIGE